MVRPRSFGIIFGAGDTTLASSFPRLFAMAPNKHAMVYRGVFDWQFQWRGPIRGGAMQEKLDHLRLQLELVHFQDGADSWRWDWSSDRVFSVKSARAHIDVSSFSAINLKVRWVKFLPRKVNVFLWRVMHNRLPTR